MSRSVNTERFRVRDWIAEHRLGGRGGTRLGFHGNCSAPVELFARGLPDRLMVSRGMEPAEAAVATVSVRCRKCDECRVSRARMWAARARDELAVSTRTWFGTLTLAPDIALDAQFRAELRLTRQGWALSEVSETKLFRETVQELVPELQRFLKRIRKNSGARLRYIIVAEAHKSGVPHFHMLLHENAGSITKRCLDASWRYGFSQFRLVPSGDSKVPYYVTKYLTKSDTMPRMLASRDYGRTGVRSLAERLQGALDSVKAAGVEKSLLERRDP